MTNCGRWWKSSASRSALWLSRKVLKRKIRRSFAKVQATARTLPKVIPNDQVSSGVGCFHFAHKMYVSELEHGCLCRRRSRTIVQSGLRMLRNMGAAARHSIAYVKGSGASSSAASAQPDAATTFNERKGRLAPRLGVCPSRRLRIVARSASNAVVSRVNQTRRSPPSASS